MSASVLDGYLTSRLQGYLQSKGYEQDPAYDTIDRWRHTASVIGPPNHVIMLSFQTSAVTACDRQTVEVLVGGRNISDADLVATVCEGSVPAVTVHHTDRVHVRWTIHTNNYDGDLDFNHKHVRGFRLRFSFHEKTTSLLQQLPSGLWNCSVPLWPEFESHFRCNYDTECVGAEDETDCPYTGHCPPGHVKADGRCYIYAKPRGATSWLAANILCAERYGGYLASFNSPQEWSGVLSSFSLGRTHLQFFVGLRTADAGKPHMYRRDLEWADGSTALYRRHWFHDYGDIQACGKFLPSQGEISVSLSCLGLFRHHVLCELANEDSKPPNANSGVTRSISSNQTLPFSHVRCPKGHMTHRFLACDAKSSCFRETYVSNDVTGLAFCSADLPRFPAPFQCENGFKRVPYSLVCDHRADCRDSSDEEFCVFHPCSTDQMKCGASKQCVPRNKMCDGPVDCADGSDERNCARTRSDMPDTLPPPALVQTSWEWMFGPVLNIIVLESFTLPCTGGRFQCVKDGYCFEVQFRCNGVRDCPGGQDEAGCAEYSCPGMYRCRGSRVCYPADKLCDSFGDCPQQDDELFCVLRCPANCTCYGGSYICQRVFAVSQFPYIRYLDASDSGLTPQHVNHSGLLIHLSLARCGLLHLGNLTLPNLRSLDLSGNRLSAVSVDEVNRLQNLQELILADSPLTSVLLTEQSSLNLRYLDLSHVRLTSLSVRTQLPFLHFLNLSFTGLEDLQGPGFQLLSNLRAIDLRGCPLTHFPRHIFRDLQQLRTVFADSYRMCCQETLPPGFNPQHCHSPEDPVSSCDRLLKHGTHSVLVAVIAAVSIIGNTAGFVVRVSTRTTSRSQHDFFFSHLCASDLINGIYLAVIGVADRLYRGTFVWEAVAWRQSVVCTTAGVLFATSSQVSGLVVFIITVDHVVFLSFRRIGFTSKPLTLHAVTFVVWVLGFVSATAPLFAARWRHSIETAICIPLLFTERDSSSSSFLDLVVIPQCILHVGVMAAQVYVYLKTQTDPSAALKADSVPSQIGDARRFLPVAVGSCLCRMSLLVLAVSLYEGSITSTSVRVAASLVVLPLSSALHPVLYAYGALNERRQAAQSERLLKYLMAKRRARVLHVK